MQTMDALDSTAYSFEGEIHYDIANSDCAAMSLASWAVMNPSAAATLLQEEGNMPEVEKDTGVEKVTGVAFEDKE